MKPKYRTLLVPSILLVITAASGSLSAQTGTWTSLTTGGTWSDIANWSSGVGPVADGAGNTADFSTIDLPTGAFTVNLGVDRTIGNITVGDTDAVTTAGTWALAGTTTLTLAGTAPTIQTGVSTTLSPIIAGAAGLVKTGAGPLILTNANTFTGGLTVSAGQLTTRNGLGAGPVANVITLANGTIYRYERAGNASTFQGYPISLAPASSVNITTDNAANGYSGVITGDAGSTVTIGAAGATTQCSFSLGANTQQFGGVLGTVKIFDGASIRFSSTNNVNNGGTTATFDIGVGSDLVTRNAATVNLGALTGVGTVTGSGGANGTAIFSVGAKGIPSTYAGVIRNGDATARFAALTKVGAEKLTLTGENTYTGATNVNVGTLEIGNGGSTGSIAGTNVTVAALAFLDFNTSGTQTVSGIIAGAGTITKKGTGTTTLTGVNTFTVSPVITGGVLAVNADTGLGNAVNIVTFPSGSGKLGSDADGVVTARAVTISAGATGGFSAHDATDSLEVSGLVSGDGTLEIGGAGLVRLTGANTYLGNTQVLSGTFSAANVSGSATSTGTVTIAGGLLAGPGIIGGPVSVASGAGIKPGPVTPTTSAVGTLSTGALTLAGGSTLYTEFTDATTFDKVAVTGNVATSGASVGNPVLVDLRLANSVAKWTSTGTYNLISYTGTFAGNADDLFEVTAASKQAGLTYTFAASGGIVSLTISGNAPSEWNINADGAWDTAGNWINGVPNAAGANARFGTVITAPHTVTVNTAKTVAGIQFNNPNSYTVTGSAPLNLSSSAGNAEISVLDGSHTISTPLTLSSPLGVSLASPANVLTLSGAISGSGSIINPTAGALELTGANTFGGGVNFSGGSLTFGNGSLGTGDLTLANSTLRWNSGNTQDISNRVVSVGGTNVTFDTNGNDVALANAIGANGSGNFIKAGAGRLTLAATPAYLGTTSIAAGTLQTGTGGAAGLPSGAIANNGTLAINLADGTALPNLVSGTGSFEHAGSGSLVLNSQNTFSGSTVITQSSATLALTDPLNLQNSTLQYNASGGTLNFGTLAAVTLGGIAGDKNLTLENATPAAVVLSIGNNGAAAGYSGILSGSGSLTKIGAGVQRLTGVNTYTGATVVNGGDLTLGVNGAISGAGLTVTTGRMVVSGGALSTTTANLGVGSGGLLVEGGSATFSGAVGAAGSTGSTNSGLVKITDGVLTLPSLTLGRGGLSNTAEPVEAPLDTNLYVAGGDATITGNLFIGTGSAQPNSSVVTRIDGGKLTVGGSISVGLNNGGRWSTLDVNGGELHSTNAVDGIVLGGPFAGSALLAVRSGLAVAEIIHFGQGAVNGNGLIKITGGELYVGAGGIQLGSTGVYTSEIRLLGGTLGAKANWSTTLPVNVAGTGENLIKAGNLAGDPFDIAISGALTGIGGIVKTGKGVLTLSGGNSYTGSTTVREGTLKLTTRTLADVGTVVIDSTGVLELAFSGGDKITELSLEGVSVFEGIYGRVGRGLPGVTETPFITGEGLLYVGADVPVSPGYDTWAALPENGLTVGLNDGPNQDPDFDGIANLLEYVLGGNPSISSTAILPILTPDPVNFIFTFNRQDDSLGNVGLVFQHGSNLTGWTDIVIPETSGGSVTVTPGAPADVIKVSIPKGSNTTLFGRLKAVK